MLFTRTTLLTIMFIVIIMVSSLKSMCIPSFVLIGCCVSELHGHLCPCHNVWPKVVLQELHCLSNCLHAYSLVVKDFYRYAKFRLLTPAGF